MIQQPQAGIAALPQQAAPGQSQGIQAALPQMKPQPGGPTSAPQAFIGPLTQQDVPQLLQEFNNPQSQYPKFAVLAAMKERQEKDRMRQAIQGQGAMQQAQQQRGTVADDVLAQAQMGQQPPPVMAAQGGMMRGYASGGPVAFAEGGVSQEFGDSPEALAMDELRVREAQIAKKRAEDRARYEFLKNAAPEVAARMAAENPELLPPSPSAAASVATRVGTEKGRATNLTGDMRPTTLPPSAPRRPPGGPAVPSQPAPAGIQALSAAPPTEDAVQRLVAEQVAAARARQAAGQPPELVAANKGIAALAEESIAAQRAEAEELKRERLAAQAAAQARKERGLTAKEWFDLANFSTRRGEGVGSLARAASGVLGGREAAAEAARKEDILAQREQRGMQGNIRQAQMLEMVRKQQLAKGDFEEAAKTQAQIDALLMGGAKYGVERGDVAAKRGFDERELAQRATLEREKMAASASVARIQAAARNDPQSKEAFAMTRVQAAINSSPMLKALAEKAKFDPKAAAEYAAEEQRLYRQLAPDLLQKDSAPAPGAALKYNPATGKIE
jgi:hypothetical protein